VFPSIDKIYVIGVSNDLMFAESKNTSHQRRNGIFDGNQMSDYANVVKEPLVATRANFDQSKQRGAGGGVAINC